MAFRRQSFTSSFFFFLNFWNFFFENFKIFFLNLKKIFLKNFLKTEPIACDRDIIMSHGIFLFFFMPSPYLNILYNTIKELNLSSTYSVGVMLQCDSIVMETYFGHKRGNLAWYQRSLCGTCNPLIHYTL